MNIEGIIQACIFPRQKSNKPVAAGINSQLSRQRPGSMPGVWTIQKYKTGGFNPWQIRTEYPGNLTG